jgi:uroporphyrinogen-III synthase
MREIPLGESAEVGELARRLREGALDVLVLLTGVGTRALAEAIAPILPRDAFAAALRRIAVVARGPKPVAALRELGLAPAVTAPEPNTWKELLAALDEQLPVGGCRVAVQEYGEENPELVAGLRERGADVLRVPVYRWALPEDVEPLRRAIDELVAGTIGVVLVTSATQIDHLFRVAGAERADALAEALRRVVVASIGPVASAALRRRGIEPDLEAAPPKMGPLVLGAAARAPAIFAAKGRRVGPPSGAGSSV